MSILTGAPNTAPELCPELATPSIIITKQNVNSLKLSNYSRSHGTTVNVSCLASPDYHLVGASQLTCLNSSQWDKDTPLCQLVEPMSEVEFDISMVPLLVAAGGVAVLLLSLLAIMTYVVCCLKQSKTRSHARRLPGSPIGLFRSLSVQEAESVFNQRRHRYYAASEYSDVMDSVSTRMPPHILTRTPDLEARRPLSDAVSRSSPTTYVTALSRGTEPPLRTRAPRGHVIGEVHPRPLSDTMSRSSPTTYITAASKGTQPPLRIQITTGQPYRTWHELFYNSIS